MAKKLVKILSIDGGGVRGIIPLHILVEIERQTGKKCADMFDMISGNSIGGIISLLLTTPDENKKTKYSAEDILSFFKEHGPVLFTRYHIQRYLPFLSFFQEKYDTQHFIKLSKKFYGDELISDATTEILIPSFELEADEPFFFKRWEARKDPYKNFKLLDAAMATSAAPTFVKPYIIEKPLDPDIKHYAFVDGGVVANNPAMCAYAEAKVLFPDATNFLIVSLGTGNDTAKILLEKIKNWGTSQWLIPIFDLILGGQADVVDHQLKTLLKATGDQLSHYFRIQVDMVLNDLPIDDSRPLNLHVLNILGANVVKKHLKEIDEICKLLSN